MAFRIQYYCTSSIGRFRSINQDNFFCSGEYMSADNNGTDGILCGSIYSGEPSVFAVFDGIGGGVRGEMSAFIAAEALKNAELSGKPKEALVSFCLSANRRICDYAIENGIKSTGTTAAMVLFGRKKIHLCNIGDSKILRIANGSICQLSKDHISFSPFGGKGALSQHLGIPESEFIIMPYTAKASYRNGAVYLICSDGLTDMVENNDIFRIISDNDGENAAKLLLDSALENGGRDNITFILLYITE